MSEEQNNKQEEQKIKRGKNFDVFISYRRSDGTVKAKALDLAFSMDDCRTFLDFKSLGTGAFDKRLENAVLDAPIFIMVWTPDYFKRCVKGGETADGKTVFEPDEDDWVRKEIELALANSKKIIPINYDKVLDNIPDYLDEDLKKGLGVHQFVNLYGDNTFDDAVKGIFDREIRPFIGATPKPENKVKVRVKADADCELLDNNEVIATIQQGKTTQLFFERGEYELIARSIEFPHIYEVIKRTFDDVSYNYLITTNLSDKVQELRFDEYAKKNNKLKIEQELAAQNKLANILIEQRIKDAEKRKREEEAGIPCSQPRYEVYGTKRKNILTLSLVLTTIFAIIFIPILIYNMNVQTPHPNGQTPHPKEGIEVSGGSMEKRSIPSNSDTAKTNKKPIRYKEKQDYNYWSTETATETPDVYYEEELYDYWIPETAPEPPAE